MAILPSRKFRVKSPSGAVHSLSWSNARDLVRNAGYVFVNDEKAVIKDAQDEAKMNAFIEGNDPSKIDVDALTKAYSEASGTVVLDDMTREELLAYAEANKIDVDKRKGSDKLLADIKAHLAAQVAAEGADEVEDAK